MYLYTYMHIYNTCIVYYYEFLWLRKIESENIQQDYKASSDRIYITLNILPLQKVVTHRIALMMYKYSHGMLPQMIQDLYVTRQSNLLHVPPGVHTNNFRYKSILIWNKLSTLGISFDIPISRFKITTKDLLQHNCYIYKLTHTK